MGVGGSDLEKPYDASTSCSADSAVQLDCLKPRFQYQ